MQLRTVKNFCHGCISTTEMLLRRASLSYRYGVNGKKYVLCITPGQSDHFVLTIASNCMEKNTRSSIAFGFTISCQATVYTLLTSTSASAHYSTLTLIPDCLVHIGCQKKYQNLSTSLPGCRHQCLTRCLSEEGAPGSV